MSEVLKDNIEAAKIAYIQASAAAVRADIIVDNKKCYLGNASRDYQLAEDFATEVNDAAINAHLRYRELLTKFYEGQ